jgi:transposase
MSLIAQYLEEKRACRKEELSDKQKKIDHNKNGKIDGEDLAKLRKEEKDEDEEESEEKEKKVATRADRKIDKNGKKYAAGQIKFNDGQDDGTNFGA